MHTKILLLSSLLLLGSCQDSRDLDKLAPAAERTREVLTSTQALLEGHSGTWRFIYFPDNNQEYGGYTYYLSFAEGRVTAFSELSDTPATSSYDVLNIDMPTLAFDTRNSVLHHFSTATEYFRNARGGDFELLLMGRQSDTLLLEGRKYHNRMRLEKMSEAPTTEVAAIRAMHARLQGKGLVPTTIGTETDLPLRLVPTYRQLEYTPKPEEGKKAKTHKIPFRYTPQGIRFYQPDTIGGVILSELLLSQAGDALVTPDGSVSIGLTTPPLDLMTHRYVAKIVKGSASDLFVRSLTSVNRTMRREHSTTIGTDAYFGINIAEDVRIGLVGNDTHVGSFIFHQAHDAETNSRFRLAYDTDFVGVGSDPTLLDIVPLDGNESSYWYAYESAKSWINLFRLRGPYRVTSTTKDGVTTYRLTSTKDEKYWFDLTLAE